MWGGGVLAAGCGKMMKHVELSVVDRKIQHDVRAIQHDLMIRLLGSAWCFSNAVSTDTWIFDEQNMGL